MSAEENMEHSRLKSMNRNVQKNGTLKTRNYLRIYVDHHLVNQMFILAVSFQSIDFLKFEYNREKQNQVVVVIQSIKSMMPRTKHRKHNLFRVTIVAESLHRIVFKYIYAVVNQEMHRNLSAYVIFIEHCHIQKKTFRSLRVRGMEITVECLNNQSNRGQILHTVR